MANNTITVRKILMPLGGFLETQGMFDWDLFLKKMRLPSDAELYTFSHATRDSINRVTYYDIDAELQLQHERLPPQAGNLEKHRYLVFFLADSRDTVAKVPQFLRGLSLKTAIRMPDH